MERTFTSWNLEAERLDEELWILASLFIGKPPAGWCWDWAASQGPRGNGGALADLSCVTGWGWNNCWHQSSEEHLSHCTVMALYILSPQSRLWGPCGRRPDIIIFLIVNAYPQGLVFRSCQKYRIEWMKNGWIKKFYPGFSILSTCARSSVFDNDTQGQVIKGYRFIFNETK